MDETMDKIDDYTDEERLIEYYDRKICRIDKQRRQKQVELDNKMKEIESSLLEMEDLKKRACLVEYKKGDKQRTRKE